MHEFAFNGSLYPLRSRQRLRSVSRPSAGSLSSGLILQKAARSCGSSSWVDKHMQPTAGRAHHHQHKHAAGGFHLRKSLTSPWLLATEDQSLTSGMETSLVRWEESQGMRADLRGEQTCEGCFWTA